MGVLLIALHAREVAPQLHDPAALGQVLIDLMTRGPGLVATIGLTAACVIGGSLLAARLTGPSVRVRLRWERSRLSLLEIAVGTLGMLALGLALEGLASHLDAHSATLEAIAAAAQAPLTTFVPLFVIGTVGAGIGEESFFRGYMGSVLGERWPRWASILATSACFGALHGDPIHSPLAFCIGLYLGWLAERGGSIRPTMFIHAVNNAVSFLQARYGGVLGDATASPITTGAAPRRARRMRVDPARAPLERACDRCRVRRGLIDGIARG